MSPPIPGSLAGLISNWTHRLLSLPTGCLDLLTSTMRVASRRESTHPNADSLDGTRILTCFRKDFRRARRQLIWRDGDRQLLQSLGLRSIFSRSVWACLCPPPPNEIGPKDDAVEERESRKSKPLPGCRIGDASGDCELLGIERLVECPLPQHICQARAVKLLVFWHRASFPNLTRESRSIGCVGAVWLISAPATLSPGHHQRERPQPGSAPGSW